MKAIVVRQTGDASVLRLEDVDAPRPGPGEALVRVEAVGINFIEVYQRTGLYARPLPFTPGSEAAGEVIAVGDGVTRVEIWHDVCNTSSAAIPERLGFREEGVQREVERIGERYNDHAVYGLLAPEWVQQSA